MKFNSEKAKYCSSANVQCLVQYLRALLRQLDSPADVLTSAAFSDFEQGRVP